jgi:predicted transcriptional regulator
MSDTPMPNPIPEALKEAAFRYVNIDLRKLGLLEYSNAAQYFMVNPASATAIARLLWKGGWREPVDPPKTMTITLTNAEKQVLEQLADKQELTQTGILRQALRLYQLVDAELVTVKRGRELERQGNG